MSQTIDEVGRARRLREEQALADLLVNATRPELYRGDVNEAWRTLARAVLDAGYRKVGDQ